MKPFLYVLFLSLSFLSEISNAQPNNRKAIEELTRQEKSLRIHADAAARDAQLSLEAIRLSAKTFEEATTLRTSAHDFMEKSNDLRIQALQSFHKRESIKTRLTADDKLRQSIEIDNLKFSEKEKNNEFDTKLSAQFMIADYYLNPVSIRAREQRKEEQENLRKEQMDIDKRGREARARLHELLLEQARQER
jgi:hypothetical protein